MNNDDEQNPNFQQETPLDAGASLGYGQGLEYQYLNPPTQPLQLRMDAQQERLRVLRNAYVGRRKKKEKLLGENSSPSVQPMSMSKAALVISAALIAGRALGLLRSSLFTVVFQPGTISDAYVQASLIPDLIYNIVTGGALLSAFIPVFNSYLVGKREERTAWQIASSALNLATLCMLVLASLVFVFTRQIVALYNYGASASQVDLITVLTRILLLQAVIMGAGVIVSAILNARKHFLLSSVGSVLYGVGSIGGLLPGLVLLRMGQRNDITAVYCAIWGIVIGAVLLVCVQLPGLAKLGMRYSFSFRWRHPGVVQIAQQMVPRIVNAFMLNLSTAVDRSLILLLALVVGAHVLQGLLTQYALAFSLVLLPLGGVMAVATAAFPTMTEYVAQGHMDYFRAIVSETLRSILFIAVPASIGLMLLAFPLIQALYEHGRFNLSNSQSMTIPLICFALGLPGLAAIEILTRAFYALRDSTTPVVVSVAQFVAKIALSLLLIDPAIWLVQILGDKIARTTLSNGELIGAWSMGALALSTSIAVLVEATVLLWLLHRYIGGLQLRLLVVFVVRVLVASLPMSLSLIVAYWLLNMFLVTTSADGQATLSVIGILFAMLKLLIVICIGSFVYLRVARFIGLLSAEKLGPVYRLLIRLRLAWI